jgi:hypothetical protein
VFNELGFPYCFCHQFTTYPVDKPDGFSKGQADLWEQEAAPQKGEKQPVNVIMVMNEAFSDITDHEAFAYTDETVENLSATLLEFIRRDFNHPCIITWVPLNESWGVPQIISNERQRMTASMLYYMTKAAALWVCVVWQGGS